MADTSANQDILKRYNNVAVIGAGVIGGSWTALFLAHGLKVVVNDPRPDVETELRQDLKKIAPTLDALGLNTKDLESGLSFEPDLERAVAGADVIQENGPERIPFKQELWTKIEKAVKPDALLLSSSSAITATKQAEKMQRPQRLLIGHPFNPPHLIPLVEVVPGQKTERNAVEDAAAFYRALGKVAKVLRKEINGFVANRLQRAIFRECVYLVQQGVVTIDELDDVVTNSIGLRWATNGPFRSYYLGGGPGGFEHFFKQFGPGMQAAWAAESKVEVKVDEPTIKMIVDQAAASFGKESREALEADRDEKQLAILRSWPHRD